MTSRPHRTLFPILRTVALLCLWAALAPAGAPAQETRPPADEAPVEAPAETGEAETEVEAPVVLEAVWLEPTGTEEPVLVRLAVELANRSERSLTAFGFDVEVEGVELPIYERQLFMRQLGGSETLTLDLYNFWSAETGRPAPADGRLDVRVTLREARWLEVKTENGMEIWETGDPVPGLPVAATARLELGDGAE